MSTALVRRGQIHALQAAIEQLPDHFTGADGDNEHVQLQHFFSPGVYVRQLSRKAGVLIVGKEHRDACVTILLSGRLMVASSTDDVPPGTVVDAGAVWVSRPGTKRATFALEDSVLITIHQNPTNTQNLEELEAAIVQPDTPLLETLE